MVHSQTLHRVSAILCEHAYGEGITVTRLRQLYPTSVRRVALLECLRELEDLGLVLNDRERVRWIGPVLKETRPLGIPGVRVRRMESMTPSERVAAWIKTASTVAVGGR